MWGLLRKILFESFLNWTRELKKYGPQNGKIDDNAPRVDINRLYLKKNEERRGLASIEDFAVVAIPLYKIQKKKRRETNINSHKLQQK